MTSKAILAAGKEVSNATASSKLTIPDSSSTNTETNFKNSKKIKGILKQKVNNEKYNDSDSLLSYGNNFIPNDDKNISIYSGNIGIDILHNFVLF